MDLVVFVVDYVEKKHPGLPECFLYSLTRHAGLDPASLFKYTLDRVQGDDSYLND